MSRIRRWEEVGDDVDDEVSGDEASDGDDEASDGDEGEEEEASENGDVEKGANEDGDIEANDVDDNKEASDDVSDADSGIAFSDGEKIPDPLSDDSDDEIGILAECEIAQDPGHYLQLGKCFSSPEEFKIALLKYSLESRYDIKVYRSESTKVGAKCSSSEVNCPWRCYASYEKRKLKLQIKVFVDEHVCVRSGYSKLLKQQAIVWLFSDRLAKNPKLTKSEMVKEVKREYNLVVTEDQCSKAKTYLAKKRKQSHELHFLRIWDYQAEVLQSNRGSTFEIETIPGPTIGSMQRFYRLYICFKSQREAWKQTCRPIIGLDGAFLKWDIKGHLLAAVGRDGDNRIVPIAWAVVEIENDDNWDWFVKQLSRDLQLDDGAQVSIISDKQKGLVKAIANILPRAEHRQCARHILDNWKKDNHDIDLQRIFWRIAHSYTDGEYALHMDSLKRYNPTSYETLLKTNPSTWVRAFFRLGSCCDDVLNNLSESFNRTIRQARKKPILDMLEDIRRQCMVRNQNRSVIAGRLKSRFTKRAMNEIERMTEGSKDCTRFMARNNLHEVEVHGVYYRVDMNARTCGCRKWQLVGIPCIHAAAVIIGKKESISDYVDKWYSAECWRLTYEDGIQPVQGEMLWPRLNRLPVLPPQWRKGNPGRPSNYARRKGRNESTTKKSKLNREGRKMTCSKCKQEGHNKRACKNDAAPLAAKKSRGRPRKSQEPSGSQVEGPQASQLQGSQVGSQSIEQQWGPWFGIEERQGSQGTSDGWRPWF